MKDQLMLQGELMELPVISFKDDIPKTILTIKVSDTENIWKITTFKKVADACYQYLKVGNLIKAYGSFKDKDFIANRIDFLRN